ncbi:MAG: MATE family efflux transporter [Treponema sp.]|nr:MATE family efflux transporter [Treponema sp.]
MTERWNNRALFRLLWPFVIEQVLGVTMGAADTVMVSSVGEFAVSGVNIIDNINNLLIIAFISLATGGAVVCSQYIGRQDTKNVRLASRQLVYSVTIVSLVITVLALLFRRPVIRAFYGAIDNDVMNAAMIYFLITNLSNPLLALYNSCAALFRAAGNSQVPMRVALLVNVIHIAVNAYFLFVLHIGVAGVALSTFLSRAIAAVVLLGMLVKNRHYPVSLAGIQKIKLDFPMIRKILNIGLPTGLEQSMFQFGRLLTQRVFPFFGTSIIAANAVASVINSFSFMTGNAFALALITVVGQCIGAGDFETAKNYTAKIIKVTWLSTFIISAAIFAFRGSLLDLFRLSPEAHAAARSFVTVHCFSMAIGWTFSFALPSALRAAGDARYIMVVGTVSMWLVRVFFAYFLSLILKLGPIGVWFAMGGDFVFRGIFFIFRWKSGRWQKIKVIDT